MMIDNTVPDEFDAILRDTLADVARETQPDPDLALMLIANARAGRSVVSSLTARRQAARWSAPLLAAASIVALCVGVIVVAKVVADRHSVPPSIKHSAPVPTPTVQSAPVVPQFRAQSVFFSDASHGWALGQARCASRRRANCATLVATSDGGNSWRRLAVPKGLVSPFDSGSCGTNGAVLGPCVDAVLFANPSDGYLWSLHDIYSTTDGGRTWSRYVDPNHDWDGASRMVIVGNSVVRVAPVNPCSSGCAGTIEIAPVGTTRWQVVHPTSQLVGLYSSNLAVARGTDVYLFAGGTAADTSPGIFRSGNGGRSWARVAANVCGVPTGIENDPFYGAGSTVANDAAIVVHCAATPRDTVREADPAFPTRFSSPHRFPRTASTPELVSAESKRQLVAADTSDAYGPGNLEAIFYVTSDGGHRWTRESTVPVRGDTIRFTANGRGTAIAQGDANLYATDDGGRTWRRVPFSS